MNSGEHVTIGIIAFSGYAYVIGNIISSINDPWIWGVLAAVIGSVTPDILEPATSYRHRGLFHSYSALLILIVMFVLSALINLIIAFFLSFSAVYIVSCFFLGYLFHLLADSITPMGLPG